MVWCSGRFGISVTVQQQGGRCPRAGSTGAVLVFFFYVPCCVQRQMLVVTVQKTAYLVEVRSCSSFDSRRHSCCGAEARSWNFTFFYV